MAEEYLSLLVDEEDRHIRIYRLPRLSINDILVTELIRFYRLSKDAIFKLIEELSPYIQRKTKRSYAINVETQVLCALRFFSSGSFQSVIDVVHISQPTTSRIITNVCNALYTISKKYVNFPLNDLRQLQTIKQGFFKLSGFPNVIGAIDCSHIGIKAPKMNQHLFINRKGFSSLNCQFICDHEGRILHVCAKWPGSTHDSFIWRNSEVENYFQTHYVDGWLLGDSGYPLQQWLLTPINGPTNNAEEKYNSCHSKTRVVVERCFGQLKSRFRCLDKSGGTLQYTPERCTKIIIAASVLHNICKINNIPDTEELSIEEDSTEICTDTVNVHAQELRRQLITRFFL